MDIDGFCGAGSGILIFHAKALLGAVFDAGSALDAVHSVDGPGTAFFVHRDRMGRTSF